MSNSSRRRSADLDGCQGHHSLTASTTLQVGKNPAPLRFFDSKLDLRSRSAIPGVPHRRLLRRPHKDIPAALRTGIEDSAAYYPRGDEIGTQKLHLKPAV